MEPFSGTWTLLVLGNIILGILGNRTDHAACRFYSKVVERLRGTDPPVNHDLQRAVRKAILQATLVAIMERLKALDAKPFPFRPVLRLMSRPNEEVQWLEKARRAVEQELKQFRKATYNPPSSEAEGQIELLLQPQGVTAQERAKELREQLKEEILAELRQRIGEPPEEFVRLIREGWQPEGSNKKVDWFDLVCAFFAEEVKTSERLHRFLTARLLANLLVQDETEESPFPAEQFFAYLEQQGSVFTQRLEEIREQLQERAQENRAEFEELRQHLDTLQVYLVLLPDIQQRQQTLEEFVADIFKEVQWIRRHLSESHTAYLLADKTRKFLRAKRQQAFIGRKDALQRLNRFITEQPSGVAIVYAPRATARRP